MLRIRHRDRGFLIDTAYARGQRRITRGSRQRWNRFLTAVRLPSIFSAREYDDRS